MNLVKILAWTLIYMYTEKPPWLDDAFDDIIGPMADDQNKEEEEANEPSDLDEKDLWIPARSRSKSKSEDGEDHGNIDLSLPGVDVEIGPDGVDIEANIGQQGEDNKIATKLGKLRDVYPSKI